MKKSRGLDKSPEDYTIYSPVHGRREILKARKYRIDLKNYFWIALKMTLKPHIYIKLASGLEFLATKFSYET